MIDALDKPNPDIAIGSYGLSMTTIEEVFLRYCCSLVSHALFRWFRLVQEEEERIDDENRCTEEMRRVLAKEGNYISIHLDGLI